MTTVQTEQAKQLVIKDFGAGKSLESILCPHTKQAATLDQLITDVRNDPDVAQSPYADQLRADLGTYNTVFQIFKVERGDLQSLRRILMDAQTKKK